MEKLLSKSKEIFETYGAVQIKNLISEDLSRFLTHVLLRKSSIDTGGDPQVPNCLAVMEHEILFDTLLEKVWPEVELLVQKQLIPTYSYARLYNNGAVLEKHTDRPACEISVTLQLGRSHNYAWPIYMGKNRYDLNEGDAVIYSGCNVEHWRHACDGPEDYYSGQVFLHFVDANGPYKNEFGDNTVRNIWKNMFVYDRDILMYQK